MREVEVTVPPKFVVWYVMNRSFPVMVGLDPSGDRASLSEKHHYDLYKAPNKALHVKRKNGPVLGTISEHGVLGAISEEAAFDLKALRAAVFNVEYECVIAYMFKRENDKRRRYMHPRCRDEHLKAYPEVELKAQYYVKGTPDCAVCGGAIG